MLFRMAFCGAENLGITDQWPFEMCKSSLLWLLDMGVPGEMSALGIPVGGEVVDGPRHVVAGGQSDEAEEQDEAAHSGEVKGGGVWGATGNTKTSREWEGTRGWHT